MAAKKKAKKKQGKKQGLTDKELLNMVDESKLGKGAKISNYSKKRAKKKRK